MDTLGLMDSESHSPAPLKPSTTEVPWAQEMLRSMRGGDFHDGHLVVGDQRLPIHRNVLSSSSSYFARAFSGGFKEAATAQITIPDASPGAMNSILDYIYGFSSGDIFRPDMSFDATLEILVLSQRFLLERLTKACVFHLVSMNNAWDNKKLLDVCAHVCAMSAPDDVINALVFRVSSHFYELDVSVLDLEMLLRVLRSTDLITTEDYMLQMILKWISTHGPSKEIGDTLLKFVNYQRVSPAAIASLPLSGAHSKYILAKISSERAIHLEQVESARPSRYGFALLSRENSVEHRWAIPVKFGSACTREFGLMINCDYVSKDCGELIRVCGLLALTIRFHPTGIMSVRIDRRIQDNQDGEGSLISLDMLGSLGLAHQLGECYMGTALEIIGSGRVKFVSELKKCKDLIRNDFDGSAVDADADDEDRYAMLNFGQRVFTTEKAGFLTIFVGRRVCD